MMFIDPIKWSSVAPAEPYTIDIYNQARRFDDDDGAGVLVNECGFSECGQVPIFTVPHRRRCRGRRCCRLYSQSNSFVIKETVS